MIGSNITDEKLKVDTTEWLRCFIDDRFPQGLPEPIAENVQSLALDAYMDGIRYGQDIAEQSSERRSIIIPGRS